MLVLIFALSLSADALGAGISFGARNVRIPISSKAVIGALSMCCAYLSLFSGTGLSSLMERDTATYLGSGILSAMALWIIVFRVAKKTRSEAKDMPEEAMSVLRDPKRGDMDHSGAISLKEAFVLGLALSVDMLSAGTGLVLSGIKSALFPPLAGFAQIFLLLLGERAGKRACSYLKGLDDRIVSFASALILLAVAAIRLLSK